MTIRDKIQKDIICYMKAEDKQKVEMLRYLFSQIKDKEIEQKHKQLTDLQTVKLISSQIKKLQDALALYQKSGRQELINRQKSEIELLNTFMQIGRASCRERV